MRFKQSPQNLAGRLVSCPYDEQFDKLFRCSVKEVVARYNFLESLKNVVIPHKV